MCKFVVVLIAKVVVLCLHHIIPIVYYLARD